MYTLVVQSIPHGPGTLQEEDRASAVFQFLRCLYQNLAVETLSSLPGLPDSGQTSPGWEPVLPDSAQARLDSVLAWLGSALMSPDLAQGLAGLGTRATGLGASVAGLDNSFSAIAIPTAPAILSATRASISDGNLSSPFAYSTLVSSKRSLLLNL